MSSYLYYLYVQVWHTVYPLHYSCLIVYREGDIVKQPMKKGSFVPKKCTRGGGGVGHVGVGWGGVGHAGGWGVSYRGGVGHVGVGWVGSCRGWGGSCRGGVGWGCVMQGGGVGWGVSCRGWGWIM